MENRICKKCNEERNVEEYPAGNKSTCKPCMAIYKKQYRADNIEKIEEYNAKHLEKNRAAVKHRRATLTEERRAANTKTIKAYNAKHAKEISARGKANRAGWTEERREAHRLNLEQWRVINKEKTKATTLVYREKNREVMLAKARLSAIKDKEDLTDSYLRMLIYKRSKGVVTAQTLRENPEEFELMKKLLILQITLVRNQKRDKNENTNNIISMY